MASICWPGYGHVTEVQARSETGGFSPCEDTPCFTSFSFPPPVAGMPLTALGSDPTSRQQSPGEDCGDCYAIITQLHE
jgi:hypothetical protein